VSKPHAVYVCGDNTGLAWDEPFIVMTDDGSHECEGLTSCRDRSAWCVEIVGWNGEGEPPYLHPTRYACMAHVGGVMEGLLPDGDPQ
jgi:hypothetical protein